MENSSLPENGKKKRWTVEEKAQIVRRYLKDHVGLADLGEETGSTPGLILGWAKQALEGIDQTFSREMHLQRKVLHREILEKDDRSAKFHRRDPPDFLIGIHPGASATDFICFFSSPANTFLPLPIERNVRLVVLPLEKADELINCNVFAVMMNDIFQDMFPLIRCKSSARIFENYNVVA